MATILKILSGTWYHNSNNPQEDATLINQPHVRDNIDIINKDNIHLKSSPIILGRSPKCHVIFFDWTAISRTHCQLDHHILGKWSIKDLNSTNGTFIERRGATIRVERGEFMLEKGDKIILAMTGGKPVIVLEIRW